MKTTESTFKPALMLMSGRFAAFAVTFFSGPLLARIFTQSEFGTYKQLFLVVGTLYALGQFGFAECLFYFLPAKPERGGRYVFNSVVMLGVMGIVLSTALLLMPFRIATWLSNPSLAHYMMVAALYLTFMLMATVLEITMICRKHFRLATGTYVASDIFRVAFLLVPALVTHNLKWTLWGGTIFCLARFVFLLSFYRQEFGLEFRFDGALLRNQLAYTLPFTGYVTLYTIQNYYHQFAVSSHFDTATFAIYAVGCLNIPLVDFMATPAANVMMVQMGEHIREGSTTRLLGVWHDTTRKLAFVFFPLVALLVVNAYPLITLLYTRAYAASVPIFMMWSLSILFAAFQTDGVLRVFAENRWLSITNFVRLAVIAALMSWFLSWFNIMGAVMVTLAGLLVSKAMMLVRIKTRLGSSFRELLPWRELGAILLVAMLAAVLPAMFNARTDIPAIITLPLSGMIYMAAYVLMVLGFGLLTESEKAALRKRLYIWNRSSIAQS